jgi:hypothetical protein
MADSRLEIRTGIKKSIAPKLKKLHKSYFKHKNTNKAPQG